MSNSNELSPKDNPDRDKFIEEMKTEYQKDFVEKLCESFKLTHEKTLSSDEAKVYFETFAKSLYDNSISGLGKGYGHFEEEERQKLVEAFHLQNSALLKSLGDVAARGSTFLWSNKVGRFAAMDEKIREAAGVLEEGQALADTALGTLWDKIKVIADPKEALGLTWDKSSQAWNAISKEFAVNADPKQPVHVFLPKYIGATTIFWNVELPELRNNGVKDITIHYLTDKAMNDISEIENKIENEIKNEIKNHGLQNLSQDDEKIKEISKQKETLGNEKIKKILKQKEGTWDNKKIMEASSSRRE